MHVYDKKRDFTKTKEPKGQVEKGSDERRFVIQRHDATNLHYDFRLEWEGVLLSWAVPKGPSYRTKDKRLAVKVEDHPLSYRNFEGTIPEKEYGGGTVMLFDEGTWEPQEEPTSDSIKMVLHGERLKGKWALVRMKGKDNKDNQWLLLKEKDDYAKEKNDLVDIKTSVRSGLTMEEIAEHKESKVKEESEEGRETQKNQDATEDKKNKEISKTESSNPKAKTIKEKEKKTLPFEEAEVQLAKLVDKVPEGDAWVYELKYDGYRILAFKTGEDVRLMSRNGVDYTEKFQALKSSILDQVEGENFVLDGEVVVLNKHGITDFKALQEYIKHPDDKTLSYMVFDLLALDEEDYREKNLLERKEKLREMLKSAQGPVYYSAHTKEGGNSLFDQACEKAMEGIIAKRMDKPYSGGRGGDWVKIKCDHRQEFVIGGYTLSEDQSQSFSSLILGVYEGDELVTVGRVGTGFTDDLKSSLMTKMNPLKRKTSPFKETPEERSGETITWLTPNLVAEVKFASWTKNNLLRQASFKGLREDKSAKDVVHEEAKTRDEKKAKKEMENLMPKEESTSEKDSLKKKKSSGKVSVVGVNISSPDKVMYEDEKITKEQVANYYDQVGKRMLPYVKNRILSFLRCPDGKDGSCFFQKHLEGNPKEFKKINIKESSGDEAEYAYVTSKKGLVATAQLGILEIHMWGSKVKAIENPDLLVFDLDPDEELGLEEVRQGVKDLKSVLDELSLTSFIKTSGGKGYHIVVPIKPKVDWEEAKNFTGLIAKVMEKKWPDRYISNMSKKKRKGKIYVDYQRNGRGATSVAPYSLRARKGATVSMPISWDQVDSIAPGDITLETALDYITKEDPWKGIFEVNQSLKGKKKEAKKTKSKLP